MLPDIFRQHVETVVLHVFVRDFRHPFRRCRLAGIGMTSARTRDRLVPRLREQGISNLAVLDRIRNTPRHIFVDEALGSRAYEASGGQGDGGSTDGTDGAGGTGGAGAEDLLLVAGGGDGARERAPRALFQGGPGAPAGPGPTRRRRVPSPPRTATA